MPESFAIAVQWPDTSRPYLVHLRKPYFVAEARRLEGGILYVTTLQTKQWREHGDEIAGILPVANRFFCETLGLSTQPAHFLKGSHGRDFPRYLMARTVSGTTFIVEPDHPAPLVEVKEPMSKQPVQSNPNSRFDTVTQYRLSQMRKYYQQFVERQKSAVVAPMVVPALPAGAHLISGSSPL